MSDQQSMGGPGESMNDRVESENDERITSVTGGQPDTIDNVGATSATEGYRTTVSGGGTTGTAGAIVDDTGDPAIARLRGEQPLTPAEATRLGIGGNPDLGRVAGDATRTDERADAATDQAILDNAD